MDAEFARALIAAPQPVIIGVRMRPFSLGHFLLLTQINSAFVTRDRIPLFEDLIASACICAHSWEENQKLLRSSWRQWLTLKVWGTLAGKFDVPAALLSMFEYVTEGDLPPEQKNTGGDSRELGAPASARLYSFLRTRFDESEAMDIPLNAAHLMYAAEMELAGKCELVSDTMREMIRRSQGGLAA